MIAKTLDSEPIPTWQFFGRVFSYGSQPVCSPRRSGSHRGYQAIRWCNYNLTTKGFNMVYSNKEKRGLSIQIPVQNRKQDATLSALSRRKHSGKVPANKFRPLCDQNSLFLAKQLVAVLSLIFWQLQQLLGQVNFSKSVPEISFSD